LRREGVAELAASDPGAIARQRAGNDLPASGASCLSGLQSFVPSTYFAVTVH
jgi:hypothetical protein